MAVPKILYTAKKKLTCFFHWSEYLLKVVGTYWKLSFVIKLCSMYVFCSIHLLPPMRYFSLYGEIKGDRSHLLLE